MRLASLTAIVFLAVIVSGASPLSAVDRAAPSAGNVIGVFADSQGRDCLITDANGVFSAFIVHKPASGGRAVHFSAPLPSCASGVVYLSDTPQFSVYIGDSQSGATAAYPSCLRGPIHVATVNLFGNGQTACCSYPVLPDPAAPSGRIETADCNLEVYFGDGDIGYLGDPNQCGCAPVRAEQTTWGRIKAMYTPE